MFISDKANFPTNNDDKPVMMGYHEMPAVFYKFDKTNLMNRVISGYLDEYGFPSVKVVVRNPETNTDVFVKAIIDTGAAHCLLQPSLINELKLQPYKDSVYLHPQNGLLDSKDYLIHLLVDVDNPIGAAMVQNVRVGIIHSPTYPAAMLIGAEFLKYTHFVYDGNEKSFTLTVKFP